MPYAAPAPCVGRLLAVSIAPLSDSAPPLPGAADRGGKACSVLPSGIVAVDAVGPPRLPDGSRSENGWPPDTEELLAIAIPNGSARVGIGVWGGRLRVIPGRRCAW
jgi:hypothetical protein